MSKTLQEAKTAIAQATVTALKNFNKTYGTSWTLGDNWTSQGTEFETFINKNLFPKIQATDLIQVALGNSFDWLAKEVDFIGQYSEEYVFKDSVPITMDLSQKDELIFRKNYPQLITKLYGAGILKKMKFTLNNNDVRLNFQTLSDATAYALGVYRKKISDINVAEEREIRAMLVDYALNHVREKRVATSPEMLVDEVSTAILNLQSNSDLYNEYNTASGGELGRYTTVTDISKIAILTTDKMKSYLLNTKIANTFQMAGIDLTDKIISFNTLGGAWRVTEDVTIADNSTIQLLRAMGDYVSEIGSLIPQGSIITFDPATSTDLTGKIEEIKPETENFALVFDIDAIKYRRFTKGMLKDPFYNGEYDEVQYWIHYYSFKSVSPFYNKILIGG